MVDRPNSVIFLDDAVVARVKLHVYQVLVLRDTILLAIQLELDLDKGRQRLGQHITGETGIEHLTELRKCFTLLIGAPERQFHLRQSETEHSLMKQES